jgi:hypothetical protein
MQAEEVLEIIESLRARGLWIWLDGGWGICRLPVLRDHLFARSMGLRRVRFDRL